MGEGEEGGPVGGAEPGDPSLAGEAVLPMKLRVEVGDLFIGLCAALLIVFGACLWPPKVVPKEADIRGTCWYYWRRHIHTSVEEEDQSEAVVCWNWPQLPVEGWCH